LAASHADAVRTWRPMATIVTLDGVAPRIGADVYLAPTATLIGDVHIGDRANVWFGAVLRGDFARIEIGSETSVQDNVVVHCAKGLPTIVGDRVTVGHGALLEGCVVEDGSLVGMGAVVLQHARVGAGSLIAAGAVVSERTEIPPGVLAAGVPAIVKKELSGSSQRWLDTAADEYQERRRLFLARSVVAHTDG
jgi:carbonic anhydrase/acetyltransferase-like protein (isoleucine patch superfamily)